MTTADWIAALSATGTLAAVVVAIWGEKIRATLLKVKLRLELVSDKGELTDQHRQWTDADGESHATIVPARYYHVRVRNAGRVPAAHSVQVLMTQVATRGPDGRPQVAWAGEIPLVWKFQELHPIARTVGPDAIADLCFIAHGEPIAFLVMLRPTNFDFRHDPAKGPVWITLQARATEVDSPPLRLQVAWDGKWERGEAEMARHMRIFPD